jgi:hypothetical protein
MLPNLVFLVSAVGELGVIPELPFDALLLPPPLVSWVKLPLRGVLAGAGTEYIIYSGDKIVDITFCLNPAIVFIYGAATDTRFPLKVSNSPRISVGFKIWFSISRLVIRVEFNEQVCGMQTNMCSTAAVAK